MGPSCLSCDAFQEKVNLNPFMLNYKINKNCKRDSSS